MWPKVLSTLLASLLVLTMTGCASFARPSQAVPLQADLREPCPDLEEPTGGTRAEMLRWSTETVHAYQECQSKHRRVVEAWPK